MAYTLPTFNLGVNVWHYPHFPGGGPPDLVTTGNLAYGRRVMSPSGTTFGDDYPMMGAATLLLPPLTDIRLFPINDAVQSSIIECPAGTGRYYTTLFVEDIGKGFANEHRAVIMFQTATFGLWPVPMP
jgi:hypothetical protein